MDCDDDCITISDDEVEVVETIYNLDEPFVVDLTEADEEFRDCEDNTAQSQQENQTPVQSEAPHQESDQSDQTSSKSPLSGNTNSEPNSPTEPADCTNTQPYQSTFCTQSNHTEPWAHHRNGFADTVIVRNTPAADPTQPATKVQKQDSPPEANAKISSNKQAESSSITDAEKLVNLKNLGNEKYRSNLFDDAVRVYRQANELASKLGDKKMSAILHFNLAMTYDKFASYDQAADECTKAIQLDDNYIKAHLKRAEIFMRQRKYDEAVICYEYLTELDKNNVDLYNNLLCKARSSTKALKKHGDFTILGLNPRHFTQEDIKKIRRQNALQHHPDRHAHADVVTRRIQEKIFKDIKVACDNISRIYFRE